MAEEYSLTGAENSSEAPGVSEQGATKRPRRRAGAPAGAPTVAVEPSAPLEQPKTRVADQSAAVVADAKPLNLREKRLAAKKAEEAARATQSRSVHPERNRAAEKIEAVSAEAPVEAIARPSREDRDAEPTRRNRRNSRSRRRDDRHKQDDHAPKAAEELAPSEDESVELSGNSAVFADLQELASTRADAGQDREESEHSDDSSMNDFASLLFQAPTPEPDEEDADHGDDFAEASTSVLFGAPDLDAVRRAAIEKAEKVAASAGRDQRKRVRDVEETEEGVESDPEDSNDSDSQDEKSSRRRRRRGGRGRRGRGRGDDSSVESSEVSADDDLPADELDESTDVESHENSDDESLGSSSRRRRRRRRSAGSTDEPQPDDPPNTVVRVREGRDEVKAVKGSTRLEAKKQRRKEGRESGRRRHSITESEFLARRESVKRSMIVRERPGRTQIVVLEDNILVEHYVAQKSQTSMVGNVYLGKVQNVLPSMEAAFVDIGRGRNAVLYAGEVNWDAAGLDGQPRRIELALKAGDPVLVQVTKDPIGHKGARLTSQISLPGRYLVYVPGGSMTGISRKLPDKERARLKKILKAVVPEDAGVIVRTAAEGASEAELTRDVERLQKQWEKIEKASGQSKNAPAALSTEPDLAIKVVRDIFNEDFTSLIVEGESVYQELHEYISNVAPDLLERVTRHVGTKDSFAKYRVDEQLMKAMDRKVYLPSGGSLVIDRTEAMTVVDVNTGKFTGSGGSLEETVTRNNLEAAEEIVRQLRLRDIGGIIVVDFIDMVLESNRDLVLRRMIECLSRDRTKHQVAEVTSLGLVQMTRKRVGAGLVETFSSTCEHCNGRGIQIDLDGQHHYEPPAFDDEPQRSKRRRKRGGKNSESTSSEGRNSSAKNPQGESETAEQKAASAKDAVLDLVDAKNQSDIHRLEEDQESRALARATIASIAAASTGHGHPDVVVDGQVISIDDSVAESHESESSIEDSES